MSKKELEILLKETKSAPEIGLNEYAMAKLRENILLSLKN